MKIHDLFIIYLRRTSQPYPRKTERPKVPRFMQKNGHCNIRQAAQVNFYQLLFQLNYTNLIAPTLLYQLMNENLKYYF